MRIDEINARMNEIRSMMAAPDYDDNQSEALLEEVRKLNDEKQEIEARAARTAELRRQVGASTIQKIVHQEQAAAPAQPEEVRSGKAYAAAYLKALKTGDDSEARALLTTGASGSIPVPAMLETEIKTAWESHELLALAKHSYFRGDVKIGFERSATDAVIHVEGAAAPDEETVTLGVVTISNQSIKKWITVSDEALESTTVDTMGYLYKELAHKIAEKAEEVLVSAITTSPASASATACGVPAVTASTIAADTIVEAVSLLSAEARDLRLVMNRQTYPAFVSVAMGANYAIDVFDGLKDRIVFTDKLPAFNAADSGNAYVIVGDFGHGAQVNLPNGEDITIKVDDVSLAERDLVKLVGRQYAGIGVVADRAFVCIKK